MLHVPGDQTQLECGDLSWCWSGGRFLHVLGQAVTAVSYWSGIWGLPAFELLCFLYIKRNEYAKETENCLVNTEIHMLLYEHT